MHPCRIPWCAKSHALSWKKVKKKDAVVGWASVFVIGAIEREKDQRKVGFCPPDGLLSRFLG
jgi:hypothetical protein